MSLSSAPTHGSPLVWATLAGIVVATAAGSAQAQTLSASWVKGKGLQISGTGYTHDMVPHGIDASNVDVLAWQNDLYLPYLISIAADRNGNFSGTQCKVGPYGNNDDQGEGWDYYNGSNVRWLKTCTVPIYITAACQVMVTSFDYIANVASNDVFVTVPSSDCPGPKMTAKLGGCTHYPCSTGYVSVSGSGFTPGKTATISLSTQGGDGLTEYTASVSGTLKPGPYSGGSFSHRFPTGTLCGQSLSVIAVDDETDMWPSAGQVDLPPAC